MTGINGFKELITPSEAMELFKYARLQELLLVKRLCTQYLEQKVVDPDSPWDLMSLLSFIYDTGRVNGIREERAKRKA